MAKITFRPEAVQPWTTPDQIEQPFRLVSARAWFPLLALALLCALGVVWAFVGRIPETVEGMGVLINPGRVRVIQAQHGGQILEFLVQPGKSVSRGQPVVRVKQAEMEKQLAQAKQRLAELRKIDKKQENLEESRLSMEETYRKRHGKILSTSIADGQALLDTYRTKNREILKIQGGQLASIHAKMKEVNTILAGKLEPLRRLGERKLIPADRVLQAETSLLDSHVQLSQLEQKQSELELKKVDISQQEFQQWSKLADLRLQVAQLDLKALQLNQETTQARATRRTMLQEQEEKVYKLQVTLAEQSVILSPYAGKVLELAAQVGQVAAPGGRVAVVELPAANGKDERLTTLAYFPVKSGKRIREKMEVRVTPTTVQRERFGSIIGKVKSVSVFPVTEDAVTAVVGQVEMVKGLFQPGGIVQVEVELERADTKSGFKWTSQGPDVEFTPGTTARVRVTVEERAPATYLIPALRGLLIGKSEDEALEQAGEKTGAGK